MVRKGHYKLIYYPAYPAQVFNLEADPDELVDLTDDPDAQSIKTELMAELSKICDPVLVDQSAKSTQARMVDENGGKPAIIERGDLGFSVPPGVAPMFD